MSSNPTKLILIGIDQAIPYLLKKFITKGILPNIEKLYNNGIYGEAYSCPPCDTPTNWTTIATGTTTAIHGATSFYLHVPGEPFEESFNHRSQTQLSRNCQAEYIWQVADSHGLVPFVANYPSGWPMDFTKGGMAALIWPIPEALPFVISRSGVFTYELNKKGSLKIRHTERKLETNKGSNPLKFEIEFKFGVIKEVKKVVFYILDTTEDGYNRIYLPENNESDELFIELDDWSKWISINVSTDYGKLPCFFKIKPLEISPDGSKVIIQRSSLYNAKGWTRPEEFGKKVIKNVIEYDLSPKDQEVEYMTNEEVNSYLLQARLDTLTIGNTIAFAKKEFNWDMCFFHSHILDIVNHEELAYLYEKSPLYNEKSSRDAWKNVETAYQIIDELVGYIIETCVDKDTIVTFVSDHGAIPAWKIANIREALKQKGLISYKWKNSIRKYIIDWKSTKAFPYFEPPYIWVNLEGRDPNGIVKVSEYESVRDDIIECLLDMKDTETNERIVKLALRKEDADFLGQNGDRIGDVVYYLNPPYQIFNGGIEDLDASQVIPSSMNQNLSYHATGCFGAHVYYLPTQKFGEFSVSCPLIINGPGIKKGHRLKHHVNLIDLAPTFSHMLGIPKPKNSVGRVIHEIFE
jgi:predicted AlkP superfamily phosphohydrolase/phosphomutase